MVKAMNMVMMKNCEDEKDDNDDGDDNNDLHGNGNDDDNEDDGDGDACRYTRQFLVERHAISRLINHFLLVPFH